MTRKDSPQSVIDSYRRRQQMAPYFLAGLAVLLVVVGIVILVIWFTGQGQRVSPLALLASPTATATSTATPTPVTPTATATSSPTVTLSPTVTETPTPTGPVEYTVQENDTCWDIAVTKEVSLEALLLINNFGNACPIKPGDKILIPMAGSELPTETPFPYGAPTKEEYTVKTGETLAMIADRFHTTVDAIKKENKLESDNIQAQTKLVIPANMVTPTVTTGPTNTITPGGPTLTPVPPTVTVTPKP